MTPDGDPSDDHGLDWNHLTVQRWLARLAPSRVRLTCEHSRRRGGTEQEPTVVIAGCISELPGYRVVDFAVVAGGVAICPEECPDAEALRTWHAHLADPIRALVELVGPAGRGRVRAEVRHPPVDRRALFGLGRGAPDPAVDHEADLDDYARLITSLRALDPGNAPAPGPAAADSVTLTRATGVAAAPPSDQDAVSSPPETGDDQPRGVRLRAVGCVACGVCVRACPHDALSLTGEAVKTLTHDRSLCQGETDCLDLCPESALGISGELQWNEVIEEASVPLTIVHTRQCARCRDRFAGDGDLCPACAQWTNDPFSSHLPPKALEILRRNRAEPDEPTGGA